MTVRKNRIRLVGALLALVLSLSLVGCAVREGSADDGRLRVVTTLFPYYDFARAVAGDRADVTLLLAPGREAHSFEPTPLDAVTISRADVFIYNGGEGEVWADDMLDAVGEDIGTVLRMMDFVDAREEEFSEGMQGADSHDHAHDHDHDHDHELHDHAEHDHDDSDEIEYDEHIWTSPKNAIKLCRAVADALCAADAENAEAITVSLRSSSPLPRILMPSRVFLMMPASAMAWASTTAPSSKRLSTSTLIETYSLAKMLLKPRFGIRRAKGIWPPSKPIRTLPPERAFWPLWPRPAVLPLPVPAPRPWRLPT